MSGRLTLAQRTALLSHVDGWIALGFGSGLVPVAPGTFGSLAALLPWLVLRQLSWSGYGFAVLVAFALGTWACSRAARRVGLHDPGAFVWDEFVGLWIALWPVWVAPWWMVVVGWVLFRGFDVFKPWPIRWADRNISGGFGIMFDDVLAGFATAIVLLLLNRFIGT